MKVSIATGFYESDSLPVANQRLINWRVNIPQTEGPLSNATLFGTEGLSQVETSGLIKQVNRGAHTKAGIAYELNGQILYRLELAIDENLVETYTLVPLGTIPGINRASFSDNGKQLMVINEVGDGWIIDETAIPVFQSIVDAGFKANGTPQQVDFVDSFFLVTTDSKKFIRSDSNNGLSWNSLNVFTAEADPDDIVAPIVFKNQAFIGGSQTIEAFQDIGGIFQRVSGMIINKGIFAPFGIVVTSDSFMFIGGGVNESPAIWAFQGNGVVKVSTTAIDSILSGFTETDIQSAFAYSYAKKGAYIVGFTFPKITLEYNTINQKWNERESLVTDTKGNVINTRWRANSVITAYNKVIVGDAQDGRIGILDPDFFDEYQEEILREFSSMPFQNQTNAFSIPRIELTMESGTGTAELDPKIRMRTSRDAKKYSDELWRSIGKIGEYERRTVWNKVGRFARFGVMNFKFSEKVKPVVISLDATIKGGTRG